MACIIERPRSNAPSTWQVHIRVKGCQRIARTFESKEDATRFASEVEGKLKKLNQDRIEKQRKDLSIDIKDMRMRDIIARFMERTKTAKNHRGAYGTVLLNIGNAKVSDLRRSWFEQYIAKMRAKHTYRGTLYSYETIDIHCRLISQAVHWQCTELDITMPRVPYSRKLLPDGWECKRERRLEPGELNRIMLRLRKIPRRLNRWHWHLLVRLAIETGARLQELVYAEWSEFSPAKDVWTIPANHTKSRKLRVVPLSRHARRILRFLDRHKSENSSLILHALPSKESVSPLFHRFVADANVVGLRFHDLRHEAISRMIQYKRKLSFYEIMRIVGHSDVKMLDRYANLRFEEMVSAME